MNLTDKTRAVNRLYTQLDRHLSAFKRRSCLSCVPGCGECCLKNDLEATVLEFLPAAYRIFLENEAETMLDKLENQTEPVCIFYNPFVSDGCCSRYRDRGLICRLFGFAAMENKYGEPSLVTCGRIKAMITSGEKGWSAGMAPGMTTYYLRLYGIDPLLATTYMPVNMAIREALTVIMFDRGYRKRPA